MNRMKEDFIKNELENGYTVGSTKTIMKKIANFEKEYGRSIEEFTKEDMMRMLLSFARNSFASIATYLSTIKKYNNYIVNYYSIYCIDFVRNMKIKEVREAFNNQQLNIILTKEELLENVAKLDNAYDKALLLLLFEGVRGEALEDILTLRKQDIDFQGHIVNIKGFPYKVNRLTIQALRKAIDTDTYVMEESLKGKVRTIKLRDSDYVFRRGITKSSKDAVIVAHQTIQKRLLKLISNRFTNPNVTLNSIYKSGVLNKLLEASEREGITFTNSEVRRWVDDNGFSITKQELFNLYKARSA